MNRRLQALILSLIMISLSAYSQSAQEVNENTAFKIVKLSSPTIDIDGRPYGVGASFRARQKVNWTDSRQWMLVMNKDTSRLTRWSKRSSEKKGILKSLLDFFVERTKGSTRGTYDYITLQTNPDSLAFPERRIALVVGNQNYEVLPPLKSAQKDAEDVADALSALGFDIIELYDSDYSELNAGLNKFAALARQYGVALIYFAGHGLQDGAVSYLLPVEYDSNQGSRALKDCLTCNYVIDKLEASGCRSRIFLFDACREQNGSNGSGPVAANVVEEGKPGSVILFATQAGGEAIDGDWDINSPFAEALIQNLNRAVSFPEMMDGLVRDTYFATDCRQYPVKVGSLMTDFSFTKSDDKDLAIFLLPSQGNVTDSLTDVASDLSADELYDKGEDCYRGRNGLRKNHVEALRWYELAAKKGHPEAIYSLGYMYAHGEGASADSRKAFGYYREAAEQGLMQAQYSLALAYQRGDGVGHDMKKAKEWYEKSAKQGYVWAQHRLGNIKENGLDGKPSDVRKAVYWYQQAADQGFIPAQISLGNMYFNGKGVGQDYSKARMWYEAAVAQGSTDAMCNLGYMYEKGLGVNPDSHKAYDLYYDAANLLNPSAQYNLGVMYENGTHVRKDLNEAKRWYRLSGKQGDERAKAALERLSHD